METNEETKSTHWMSNAVSWAHLLIASVSILISVFGAILVFIINNEARMTRFEERQAVNTKGVAEAQIILDKSQLAQDKRFEELRAEIIRRLDSIGADLVILKITWAKLENRQQPR